MELCVHCDEAAILPVYQTGDLQRSTPFCCEGCLTVFSVIHDKGLEAYYAIKSTSPVFKRRSPVELSEKKFGYLDDPAFQAAYGYSTAAEQRTMEFYLEGIHCLACLWLIEKLPALVPGLVSTKLELEHSIVTVVMDTSGRFSQVAEELARLGYRPHALKKNQDSVELSKQAERSSLRRIGIAGAASGNIMIYAFSIYSGATGGVSEFFNLLTVVFALPVLSYCAWPFYTSAWNSLRSRTLSIDIPISLALLTGAIMGIRNLVYGIQENYFDSLTTLVFLLLLSRYFLRKVQEKGLATKDLKFFHRSEGVRRRRPGAEGEFEEVHQDQLQVGDVLKVAPADFFPADATIIEGTSKVDLSLLTGESYPVQVGVGAKVLSGTQNLENSLMVKVDQLDADTRLGRILKNVEDGQAHSSRMVDLTSQVSKYFTGTVCVMAVLLFFTQLGALGFEGALVRAVTLLIVTCPCALALSVPLTFNRSLSKASTLGIIIKRDETLEKLAKAKHLFLDKTGTITYGKLQVVNFKNLGAGTFPVEDIIYTLEKNSRHPVGRALLDYVRLRSPNVIGIDDYVEAPGVGVFATVNGVSLRIDRDGVHENGQRLASFEIKDALRENIPALVERFKRHGLIVKVLSGDRASVVHGLSRQAGFQTQEVQGEMSPEEKCALVRGSPDSVMVGDGANDAMALEAASVGIAVCGAMDISLRAASVYLTLPGIEGVDKVFVIARETMKVIKRNLVLSITYNLVSVAFVFAGAIDPLVAAIIMPLSSLTVLCSSLVGTKELRSIWKS